MTITVNSPDWDIRSGAATRGAGAAIPGLPREFLTESTGTEEVVAEPRPATRGGAAEPGAVDTGCRLAPGEAAVLAVRHPSGALTFHAPRETSRTRGGPAEVRFIAPVRVAEPGGDLTTSRGLLSKAVK